MRKLSKQTARNKLGGGWHNSVSLASELKWTQCFGCGNGLFFLRCVWLRAMITHSRQWAESKGPAFIRKSEVHGEWEWKIPTTETFEFEKENTQEATYRGSMEVQDASVVNSPFISFVQDTEGFLFQHDVTADSAHTFLAPLFLLRACLRMSIDGIEEAKQSAAGGENKGGKTKKVSFPVLQHNQDVMSILMETIEISEPRLDSSLHRDRRCEGGQCSVPAGLFHVCLEIFKLAGQEKLEAVGTTRAKEILGL